MLQNIESVYGRKISATDGDLGKIADFYFDDKSWLVRYVVVETGSWLLGRQVLLSSHAFGPNVFGKADADDHRLRVNLTQKQIEASPPIDSHQPVSRQYEEEYYRYYGWPTYWNDFGTGAVGAFPSVVPPPPSENHHHHGHNQRLDRHLRSTKAVTGYRLHAADGEIGALRSFMIDRQSWAIRELVVETGLWYAGKSIRLLPANVDRISYLDSAVFVNLTKEALTRAAKDEIAHAGAGQP